MKTRLRRFVLLLLVLPCSTILAWQGGTTRRDSLRWGVSTTAGLVCLVGLRPPEAAHAVRGAAELDLEYYLRDLVAAEGGQGSEKQGNVMPSAPPAVAPPRILQPPLLPALLTDDYAPTCIPVGTLVQVLAQNGAGSNNAASSAREIAALAAAMREKASRAFYARAPWQTATCSDQYCFDLSAYALWRTAALLLPNYVDRDVFVRNTGLALYRRMVTEGLITVPTQKVTGVVGTIDTIRQVLDSFCQSNYCKAYRLGPDEPPMENNSKKNNKKNIQPEPIVLVDELDDQALASGATVDFLVSVLEPATLGSALQITGEQSRFAPDLVGPTLAAAWQDLSGLSCSWEVFFIDPVYRPNPKDYFPTEQLLQFTLKL